MVFCQESRVERQHSTTYKANMSTMGLDPTRSHSRRRMPRRECRRYVLPAVNNLPGCMVHVDVKYDYTFLFAPFIAAPPVTMTSSSEMLITQ